MRQVPLGFDAVEEAESIGYAVNDAPESMLRDPLLDRPLEQQQRFQAVCAVMGDLGCAWDEFVWGDQRRLIHAYCTYLSFY